MRSVLYEKIEIETPIQLFDHTDKNWGFKSIEGALSNAYKLSLDLGVVRVSRTTYFECGDYKRNVIAQFNGKHVTDDEVYKDGKTTEVSQEPVPVQSI